MEQKKSKEIKTENNNKSKVQNKKKEEEPKKLTKINTSTRNGPQNNKNECLHTIDNEHRRITTDYLGDKVKASGKGDKTKNTTPKKVQTIAKKKMMNKKIDNDDEDNVLARSMSFKISYKNEKQISKKEEKPKENKKNYTKITKKPLAKKKDKPSNNNTNQDAEAIFNYKGIDTTIQIHTDDKMKDIIDKFVQKAGIQRDDIIFMYNGVQINENLSFTQQVNDDDNNRKKLNIIVAEIVDNKDEPKQSEVISNYLICPECYDNIILNIKNYKINYKCKNNHTKNQMMLNEYEKLQKIDLTKIKCEQCEKSTKRDTFNNTFYYCFDCKKSICPLCKNSHDPNHKLFNYDDKNYYCEKHNEQFIEYCQKCEKNLCFLCKNEHTDHENIKNLQDMIIPKEEILIQLKITEHLISEIKQTVENIKFKLNCFVENIDTFYKINRNFVDNYDVKHRNYEILQNLKEILNNNKFLIKELESINREQLFPNKISNILNIYDKITIKSEQIIYPNGDKYIGELKDNQKNGKGILYYNEKDKERRFYYEGEWKNDKREGKGIIYWRNNDVYNGEWVDDNMEGKGIFYYDEGDIYDGCWKNNKKEGKGNCSFMNGNKYEGEWVNNVVEGKGIYYFSNGNKYIGEFKNGKVEGKGVMFYQNGEIEVGLYSKGKITGKYALLDSKGKISTQKQ